MKNIYDLAKEITSKHTKIHLCEIESSAYWDAAQARQICYYLIRNNTKKSLKEIGQNLGNKDHATVLYGVRTINNLCDIDKKLKYLVDTIEFEFKSKMNYSFIDETTKYNKLFDVIEKIRRLHEKYFWKKVSEIYK